jgi:hypothetical protein
MKEPSVMQDNSLCVTEEKNKTEPTVMKESLDKGNLNLTPSLREGLWGRGWKTIFIR